NTSKPLIYVKSLPNKIPVPSIPGNNTSFNFYCLLTLKASARYASPCLCLLAAYTGLARLAALANPNSGTAACIKNDTGQLRYGEPTGTCKNCLSEAKKNNATATTVCSKPTNWRTLTFGAAAKKTKRVQGRNKTTD